MDKKALPQHIITDTDNQKIGTIRQKMPEKKHMLIGIILCLVLGLLLFYLSLGVKSEKAELTRAGEPIYAPVDGIIFEVSVPKGEKVRRGDAIIHYDPMYIRTKTMQVRENLQLFKENRHNPGSLRQLFKPLLKDVYEPITKEIEELSKIETEQLKELQKITREHTKAQVQMRSKSNYVDGKPKKELVDKEKELAKKVEKAEEDFEMASLARAGADKKFRELTAGLGQSNSLLYRYLEEEYNKALKMEKNEYIYAPYNAIAGTSNVRKGKIVRQGDLLMELHPDNGIEWWVKAEFSLDDAKKLKNRQVCTVVTEDGEKLEARIFNITTTKKKAIVKLMILDAPENLKESEFVTVKAS